MNLAFQDFVPALLKPGFFTNEYESLVQTVDRANQWIAEANVEVINVETVQIPNITKNEDSIQNAARTSGDMSSFWFQVVRVWYYAKS
jgi:hypothetical protein